MTLREALSRLSRRTLDRLLAMAVLAAIAAYVGHALAFFPDAQGKLGDDYEYFLPLLLAGKYWIAENGFLAVPRFSPAFCGGLPFLANPQSIFYSAPQALSLIAGPIASFFWTSIAFALIGAGGTYALMRRRFEVSVPAAALSAVLFLFNGFLFHRMAAGQATYHVVGLAPLLCCLMLTRLDGEGSLLRRALRSAVRVAGAAAILAYFVFAGAPNLLVPLGLACLAVWLLHALLRQPVHSFWITGAVAGVIAAAAAAAKIAPAMVFVHEFPRSHEIVLFADARQLAQALFLGFFLPSFLPDHLWGLGKHEFEFGVGLAALLLPLEAWDRHGKLRALRQLISGGLGRSIKLAALFMILVLPIWLNYGGPAHAAFLKSLPYIGDNVVLVRWFFIYVMPLIVGAGSALDFVCKSPLSRTGVALVGMLVTVAPALLADRPFYDRQPYDPARVLAADTALGATGSVPPITRIGSIDGAARNEAMLAGASSHPCYEPLFGYHLEALPPGLAAGPILAGPHLRNPACYIYGAENGCAPGAVFDDTRRHDEASSAAYHSFAYALPAWQRWADRLSLVALALILLGLGLALAGRLAIRAAQAAAARAGTRRNPVA